MPQVIAAIAYVYEAWVVYALAVAYMYVDAEDQKRRARNQARDDYNAGLKNRLVNSSTVDGPRSRVYGRVRNADGVLFKATHGAKSEFYTRVIALAGHEVDGIEAIYFNDQEVEVDGNGWVLTAPYNKSQAWAHRVIIQLDSAGNGLYVLEDNENNEYRLSANGVTAVVEQTSGAMESLPAAVNGPPYARQIVVTGGAANANKSCTLQWSTGATRSRARVRKFLGAPGQDLSTILAPLFPGMIVAGQHRFAGIALLLVDLEFDQDVYPSGVPVVTAVVRGAKVYDPRDGQTRWTQNPALIARDWALYANGGGALPSELVEPSFVAAANICDTLNTFSSTSAGGAVINKQRPLYTCGIVARSDIDPTETLGEIVRSMAGRWAWTGGQLRVKAGGYSAPVTTLTESWCSGAGDIELVASVPRTQLVNAYQPTIADSAQDFVPLPAPRLAPPAYAAADGQEYLREVSLTAVTDADHAQHICGVLLRDARQATVIKLPCNMRGYTVDVFDTISVTLPRFGWSAKPFEVLAWSWSLAGGVTLTLKETDASIYDPAATFERIDPVPNTGLPGPFNVPDVALLQAESGTAHLLRQKDGTVVSRMLMRWSPVNNQSIIDSGTIELRYGRATADISTWQTLTAPGSDTQAYATDVQDGAIYLIQARARNRLVAGTWSTLMSHFVVGKSAAPAAVTGLAAAVIPGAVRISWNASTEPDYAETLLRVGASWAAGTPLPKIGPVSSYDWLWPNLGTYKIWAAHLDSTGNVGTPVSTTVTVIAEELNQEWAQIGGAGKPRYFTISTYGYVSTKNRLDAGLHEGGAHLESSAAFWNFKYINRSTGALDIGRTWHPGDPQSKADQIAGELTNPTNAKTWIVCVWTNDNPGDFMPPANLLEALYSIGASRNRLPTIAGMYRACYALVGICGQGEGKGLEMLSTIQSDAIELPWTLQEGQVSGGVGWTGFTGDLGATKNDVVYSSTAPSSPAMRTLWIDTSVTPRTIKIWMGSSWVFAGTYVNGTAQLTDDAQLGMTSLWTGVTGDGKPENGATRNPYYFQDSEPGGAPDGAIWISSTKAFQKISGAWRPYVGAGSVGTGEIAAGAATEVLTAELIETSDLTDTEAASETWLTRTYTAPFDCVIEATCVGVAYVHSGYGLSSTSLAFTVYGRLTQNSGYAWDFNDIGSVALNKPVRTDITPTEASFTLIKEFYLSAGQTVSISMQSYCAVGPSSGGDPEARLKRLRLKALVIKR